MPTFEESSSGNRPSYMSKDELPLTFTLATATHHSRTQSKGGIPLGRDGSEAVVRGSKDPTDASKASASGRPLGNAALSGAFAPAASKDEDGQSLINEQAASQKRVIVHTFLVHVSRIVLDFANAFNMDLFCFPKFSTVFTLGYRAPLLFYLKEWAICVFAGRGSMSLDASFADRVSVDVHQKKRGAYQAYFLLSMKTCRRW